MINTLISVGIGIGILYLAILACFIAFFVYVAHFVFRCMARMSKRHDEFYSKHFKP